MIRYVYDSVENLVDERIIVLSGEEYIDEYRRALPEADQLVLDCFSPCSPLAGMMTGLMHAKGEYAVVLPCDAPLVSPSVVKYLFEQAPGSDAVVPRWPYGYIEPLQSVYRVKSSLEAGKQTLENGKNDIQSLIDLLRSVLYVPIETLGSVTPGFRSFINVNDLKDLEEVKRIIESEPNDE